MSKKYSKTSQLSNKVQKDHLINQMFLTLLKGCDNEDEVFVSNTSFVADTQGTVYLSEYVQVSFKKTEIFGIAVVKKSNCVIILQPDELTRQKIRRQHIEENQNFLRVSLGE